MQDIAIVEADLGNPQHQDAIVHLVDALIGFRGLMLLRCPRSTSQFEGS